MQRDLILGIDTSNYTTSLCALALDTGEVISEVRRVLPVAEGARGLRQSDALFFHVQRLPALMDELIAGLVKYGVRRWRWVAVGASVRPRPSGTSYMPVFAAGASFGYSLARATGALFIPVSHQEGHLAAADYFLPPYDGPFLGVHLSGGTSDVVWAISRRWGYRVEMVGEGADLHAGQFVDRVGVALGCPFPAGPALERLAAQAEGEPALTLPVRVDGASMSFSGPCSAALRAIAQGAKPQVVAAAVQRCIANAVVKAVTYAYSRHPEAGRCVIAGGVAANAAIRTRVEHRLRIVSPQLTVLFAPVRYATDNALGVASITRRGYMAYLAK